MALSSRIYRYFAIKPLANQVNIANQQSLFTVMYEQTKYFHLLAKLVALLP